MASPIDLSEDSAGSESPTALEGSPGAQQDGDAFKDVNLDDTGIAAVAEAGNGGDDDDGEDDLDAAAFLNGSTMDDIALDDTTEGYGCLPAVAAVFSVR